MRQSDVVAQSEGDAWFERNKDKDRSADPLLADLISANLSYTTCLEIGCGTGWRLEAMRRELNDEASYSGCDLSWEAINYGRSKYRKLNLRIASADSLGYSTKFDLVILGFFMYLVDREDLFRVCAEIDRVLADGGRLVIHDFSSQTPHSRPYAHDHRLRAYKMDYSKLFLSNPAYTLVRKTVHGNSADDTTSIIMLRKDIEAGWPLKV